VSPLSQQAAKRVYRQDQNELLGFVTDADSDEDHGAVINHHKFVRELVNSVLAATEFNCHSTDWKSAPSSGSKTVILDRILSKSESSGKGIAVAPALFRGYLILATTGCRRTSVANDCWRETRSTI
jgi:hypothetical protein